MKLKLQRTFKAETYTVGKLFIDGIYFCDTLEDKVRDVKIKGITAIPTGKYKVQITMSNRFKKLMPLLINVPNFEGVRIHSGNTSEDTEGCILVGKNSEPGKVTNSRNTFKKLMLELNKDKNNLSIEIL